MPSDSSFDFTLHVFPGVLLFYVMSPVKCSERIPEEIFVKPDCQSSLDVIALERGAFVFQQSPVLLCIQSVCVQLLAFPPSRYYNNIL